MRNLIGLASIAKVLCLSSTLFVFSTPSFGVFLDAKGHYVMQAETRTAPGMSGRTGLYQAIDQNFRLEGEVRLNDQSSFYLEFRLFDDPRSALLGDTPQPEECTPQRNSTATDCKGRHQNTAQPGYAPLTPKITKAYMRYGFDYCIVEAGRRGRDWGLGVFMDSGNDPFDTSMSIYDGISCDVNIQKSQNLGFSFGYDKLSETGTYAYSPYNRPTAPVGDQEIAAEAEYDKKIAGTKFGPNAKDDDHDQFYFTLEYDTSKANVGSGMTYKVGIYFANIVTSENKSGIGSSTDLKFFDIYYELDFQNFAFKNEFIIRGGKSSDPNYSRLGGVTDYGGAYRNDLQSFALAGSLEWTLSKGGSSIGPEEYKEGNANRHLMFLDYAIAPGTGRGYFSSHDAEGNAITDENVNEIARGSDAQKGNATSATAFHRNFKPALIFFNGKPQTDHLRIDGIFDPTRVMNVSLFGIGYRYEDLEKGNFEVKLITGQLSESMPAAVRDYYEAKGDSYTRPIGFFGKELGYEIDLEYVRNVNRQVDLGLAAGYAIPGTAWQVIEGESAKNNFLAKSYISLKF